MRNPTPGPWTADLGEVYSVRASDGRVAYCQHVHLTGRRDNDIVAANARLIAAAPELLDELEKALPKLVGPQYHSARAAVAKARGKA